MIGKPHRDLLVSCSDMADQGSVKHVSLPIRARFGTGETGFWSLSVQVGSLMVATVPAASSEAAVLIAKLDGGRLGFNRWAPSPLGCLASSLAFQSAEPFGGARQEGADIPGKHAVASHEQADNGVGKHLFDARFLVKAFLGDHLCLHRNGGSDNGP